MNDVLVDKRPPMPKNFSWYSVCSGCSGQKLDGHYNPECPRCNAGRWVNDEFHELDSWLYKHDAKLWQKWANRETNEGEPGHEARHFLEKIFPNLRRSQ
jgi:hypothetical protein